MVKIVVAVAVLALVVGILVVVRRRRRPRNAITAAFDGVAGRRGWRHVATADTREILGSFDRYLDEDGAIDYAVGGHTDADQVVVVGVGVHDKAVRGRPWYVATVIRADLDIPRIDFDPRSVRTVRVVAGNDEVVIDDPRISRGWRITSPDRQAARALDSATTQTNLSDILHRPMPFIVGIQLRPGGVAVHLAGPEDQPTDADDLDRLSALAHDIATAMAATRW